MRRRPLAGACAGARAAAAAAAPWRIRRQRQRAEFTNESEGRSTSSGTVEMNRGDTTIYADDVVVFSDTATRRSQPGTSCSRRAATGSPPNAPSSTPKPSSARSTTRGHRQRSRRRQRPRDRRGLRCRRSPVRKPTSTSSARTSRRSGPGNTRSRKGGFTDVRSADAAVESHGDNRHPQRRSLHAAAEAGGLLREGRADVLLARSSTTRPNGRIARPAF